MNSVFTCIKTSLIIGLLIPFTLIGCSSEQVESQVEENGGGPSASVEVEPEETKPATAGFYLDMTQGCYSYTEKVDALFPIESAAKEIFATDCLEPHHFEVFSSTVVPGFDASNNLTQDDALAGCETAYLDYFGAPYPTEQIPLAEQVKTPYLMWYFPDDGLEASEYPGRLICTGVIVEEGGSTFGVLTQPFR